MSRTAFRTEQFDELEKVLVSRYERLHTEILHFQEKFDLERLMRFQAEEDLRKREELCERGKRAQSNYETLLEEVKKTSLVEGDIIRELRKKNNELELEVCELRKLKRKWVDDSNAAQGESSSGMRVLHVSPMIPINYAFLQCCFINIEFNTSGDRINAHVVF